MNVVLFISALALFIFFVWQSAADRLCDMMIRTMISRNHKLILALRPVPLSTTSQDAIFESRIKISEWTSATLAWFHSQQCGHIFNGWLGQLCCDACVRNAGSSTCSGQQCPKGAFGAAGETQPTCRWPIEVVTVYLERLQYLYSEAISLLKRLCGWSMIQWFQWVGQEAFARMMLRACPASQGIFRVFQASRTFLGLLWLWAQTKYHMTKTTKNMY